MAAAAVLLGLLRTTLSLIGSNTIETGVLSLRRPFLAGILAAGSPSVAPIRMFNYDDPVELMRKTPATLVLPEFRSSSVLILVAEYLIGAAALANLAHLSYALGVWAVCSFSSETVFHPALWAFLALALHAWGGITVRLRLYVQALPEDGLSQSIIDPKLPSRWSWCRPPLRSLVNNELQPGCCTQQEKDFILLQQKAISNLFIFCTWFTSIATVAHIIYGAVIFSTILFVSTSDAVQVVARYIASMVVCRTVLVFEVSGLRGRVTILPAV